MNNVPANPAEGAAPLEPPLAPARLRGEVSDELMGAVEPFLGRNHFNQNGQGGAPLEPPLAPAPQPPAVPEADPEQEQRERDNLLSRIHAKLQQRIGALSRKERCFYGNTDLRAKSHSEIADEIISRDFELSNQTDAPTLAEWVQKFETEPNFANALIREDFSESV